MPIAPRIGLAVTSVPDFEAARRFYVDVVSLEVKREAPTVVQFDRFAFAADQPVGEGRGSGAVLDGRRRGGSLP